MPTRYIVRGQRITAAKAYLAKQLRRKMTPEERILWEHLRGDQLGFHFRRQQIIDGYLADFYCHAAGLVLETDGPIHDSQADYDAYRDSIIKTHDLLVLRVRNSQVRSDLPALLDTIAFLCRSRTRKP